jgi:hypothetical protein
MSKNVCHPAKPLESGTVGWVPPTSSFNVEKPSLFLAGEWAFVADFCICHNGGSVEG